MQVEKKHHTMPWHSWRVGLRVLEALHAMAGIELSTTVIVMLLFDQELKEQRSKEIVIAGAMAGDGGPDLHRPHKARIDMVQRTNDSRNLPEIIVHGDGFADADI